MSESPAREQTEGSRADLSREIHQCFPPWLHNSCFNNRSEIEIFESFAFTIEVDIESSLNRTLNFNGDDARLCSIRVEY